MQTLHETHAIARMMVALANTNGGSFEVDRPARAKLAAEMTRPVIDYHLIEQYVTVPRSDRLHALADGHVYVAQKNGLLELDTAGIHALASYKQLGDYERAPLSQITISDLEVVDVGLLTEDGTPTVAAYLLHGRPQRGGISVLPQSALHLVRYPARADTTQNYEDVTGHMTLLVSGPVPYLLDKAINTLPKTGFPTEILQELVLNALLHREYRHQEPVFIGIYTDCVEIITPGGLAAFVTPDNIWDAQFTRNPQLKAGMVAHRHPSGLKLLQTSRYRYELRNNHQSFTLRLYNEQAPDVDPSIEVTQAQQRILQYIGEYGSITEHELTALFDGQPDEANLSDLVSRHLIRKLDLPGGLVCYTIPPNKVE